MANGQINLTYCHSCNVYEIKKSDAYRVCGECGHVYNKPEDLEAAWRAIVKEMNVEAVSLGEPPTPLNKPADKIYFCQECIHDF